jgi:hypothetical protein
MSANLQIHSDVGHRYKTEEKLEVSILLLWQPKMVEGVMWEGNQHGSSPLMLKPNGQMGENRLLRKRY